MSPAAGSVTAIVKDYIMSEFLTGEDPEALSDTTPLISGGILDSISTVKLVSFLEETFGIQFSAHEISTDYLDTLADITSLVEQKIAEKA